MVFTRLVDIARASHIHTLYVKYVSLQENIRSDGTAFLTKIERRLLRNVMKRIHLLMIMRAEEDKMKIRVCVSCGFKNPKLRKTGIGSMLQIKCLECGKDAGFVFKNTPAQPAVKAPKTL